MSANSCVAGGLCYRWYEVRQVQQEENGAYDYEIFQQGTYARPNDNVSRFYSSIAQDKFGNIGLGYSVSGTDLFPGMFSTLTCDTSIHKQTLTR
jgi:hypothetical protein